MSKSGRYVHRPGHPKANDMGMVNVLDLGEDNAPMEEGLSGTHFAVGRFYENLQSPIDGSDIGSRRRYHEHMRVHGVAPASEFKEHWKKAEKERSHPRDTGRIRETIERAWYNLENRKRR